MWWGGFLLCGLLLILVAIPFFSFPKILTVSNERFIYLPFISLFLSLSLWNLSLSMLVLLQREKEKIRLLEKSLPHVDSKAKPQKSLADGTANGSPENGDSGYGKDIKGIFSLLHFFFCQTSIVSNVCGCSAV